MARRLVRIVNRETGQVLAERAEVADSVLARFLGLMGRAELPAGAGLVIVPCNSVHCFFMRFPIDVIHLDRAGKVLRCVPALRPNRIGPIVLGSHSVVELPAGTIAATATRDGHHLDLLPIST